MANVNMMLTTVQIAPEAEHIFYWVMHFDFWFQNFKSFFFANCPGLRLNVHTIPYTMHYVVVHVKIQIHVE